MPEHLAEGSSEPPLVPGKLRLYGMRFCPFDHRAHLVLLYKKIPYDPVYINLKSKPDWFLQRIKSGKVPGLMVADESLYESLIIADYLDEKYPDPPLHSKDPLKKAKDRIVIENFGKVVSLFYKMALDPSGPTAETFEAFVSELSAFDKELNCQGTNYFAGDKPGMVDYMIWPFFERFPTLKIIFGSPYQLPEDKLKHLMAWRRLMAEDPTIKAYKLTTEVHAEFLKSHIAGTPNYNMEI